MTNLIFENKWLKVYKDGAFIGVEVLESGAVVFAKEDVETGCWNILSHRNKTGYGFITTKSYRGNLHRYFYLKHNDIELPRDVVIRHKCDNRFCICLDHLETGSNKENIMDRDSRGRTAKGVTANKSKLTEKNILEIRINKTDSHSKLGGVYEVSPEMISNIRHGKFWTHVHADVIWTPEFSSQFKTAALEKVGKKSGENSGCSKLTNELVKAIRINKIDSHTQLGKTLGLNDRTIKLVRYGETWKECHADLIWTQEEIAEFVTGKHRGWTLK